MSILSSGFYKFFVKKKAAPCLDKKRLSDFHILFFSLGNAADCARMGVHDEAEHLQILRQQRMLPNGIDGALHRMIDIPEAGHSHCSTFLWFSSTWSIASCEMPRSFILAIISFGSSRRPPQSSCPMTTTVSTPSS